MNAFLRRIVLALIMVALTVTGGGCLKRSNTLAPITFETCLSSLTNVATFCQTPRGQAGLISSYDRTGGNRDWATGLKVGEDGLVDVARLEGPGCVKRMWATSIRAKEWLFFFDGEEEPRLSLSHQELFGNKFPFLPPLSRFNSGGFSSYIPIPYSKSLRIAWRTEPIQPSWRQYFHINYETYPKGTVVESFPAVLSDVQSQLVKSVSKSWQEYASGVRPSASSVSGKWTARKTIQPGEETCLLNRRGGGMVTLLRIGLSGKSERSPADRLTVLRSLVLRIYWDGQESPSVDVPMGDFFCNGLASRRFTSLPVSVTDSGFSTRFPMPFVSGARVTILNHGQAAVTIGASWSVTDADLSGPEINYFHASWRQSVARGMSFQLATIEGKGHFVGCYLVSHGMDGSWNMLEGDDSFNIDSGAAPALHGTGLEDYFNGGWYYYGLYDLPLSGLLEKAAMQTAQYRFHLVDPVKFDTRLTMAFEFGDANRARGYMSGTAYWYQSSPRRAGSQIPALSVRYPPKNGVDRAGIMAQLFELEAFGLFREAQKRCLGYAVKYPKGGLAPMLYLRAAAYGELLTGFSSVQGIYQQMAASARGSVIGEQADTLLWFHQSTTNALLFGHLNGSSKVYVDGRLVIEGDNPLALLVSKLVLEPGSHEMTASVTAKRGRPWFHATLRTATTNLMTDESWDVTDQRPPSWPRVSGQAVQWGKTKTRVPPPWMSYWQFTPNAFVNAQSGRHFLTRDGPWDSGTTLYFRKSFVVPASRQSSAPSVSTSGVDGEGLDWDDVQSRSTDGSGVE